MSEIGVIDTIARALVAQLPAGWRQVSAVYRATSSYAELDADVDGSQVEVLPEGLEDHFEELRREMYRPDKGTWLTAQLTITSDGHFATDFQYDERPDWSIQVDERIYQDDLSVFPRDRENIPSWMRS
ncbi:immunity protein YezG family protein [Kribbella sp. NPDC059898]|uniref:immunity protein YezG family protein n=1 Tax=Kribbella sp. NPDC059898 TaxID=3346995 RepID=UPI003667F83C